MADRDTRARGVRAGLVVAPDADERAALCGSAAMNAQFVDPISGHGISLKFIKSWDAKDDLGPSSRDWTYLAGTLTDQGWFPGWRWIFRGGGE